MGDFSRRFPQLFVAIHTGRPGPVTELRSYGLWLLNRSIFDDLPPEMSNEAGVLLIIDPENKAAALTFGYLVEPYLREADTFDCLARAHGHWLEGRFADGIIRVLGHLEKVLIRNRARVKRQLARESRVKRRHIRSSEVRS